MPFYFIPLLILSFICCCIEIDISVPGFPEMVKYFGVSDAVISLTIAYNFLGFCIAAIMYGPLSESFGRRKVMLIGNFLLLIGAVGCVLSENINILLVFRFIQGLGASTSAVVAFAMIADAYPSDKAMKYVSIMNCIITAIMAVAPVAGGFIVKAVGFRGNYIVVATISVISWILLYFLLPETKKEFEQFSLVKVFKDYARLMTNGKFLNASLVPSIMCSGYLSFVTFAPFLYRETFGLDIITYSLMQGSVVGIFSVISLLADKIIKKFGVVNSLRVSIKISSIGTILLLFISTVSPNSPYLITLFMIIYCSGFAIIYPILFAKSLDVFPEIKGTASSAVMSSRALICSVFVGLTAYFFDGSALSIASILLIIVIISIMSIVYLMKSSLFEE